MVIGEDLSKEKKGMAFKASKEREEELDKKRRRT